MQLIHILQGTAFFVLYTFDYYSFSIVLATKLAQYGFAATASTVCSVLSYNIELCQTVQCT